MEGIITEFFKEKSFVYSKNNDKDGCTYYTLGIISNDKSYRVLFEMDFEEKYFSITAVHEKKLSLKYKNKIMNIYNLIAQDRIPVVHLLTRGGNVASKYNYELMKDETLTKNRIDHMLETVLIDVDQFYPHLKKVLKKSKKGKEDSKNETNKKGE